MRRFPLVSCFLVAGCVLVFLGQSLAGDYRNHVLILSLGMIPAVLFERAQLSPELLHIPPLLTLTTHLFVHARWQHLLVNMVFLGFFGSRVEGSLGRSRFLAFFITCGAFSGLAQAVSDPHSEIPLIGASGAIFGILGACLPLFAHKRIMTGALVFYFFTQFAASFLLEPGKNDDVAWLAHVSGFVAGMALVPLFTGRGFAGGRLD
ncbi:MAG: rhomboid family intramembrane serine protease [Gammaproteobacteria bacterium]